ncbi:MAG: ASKHA domain-containing protein [Dehalococcoidia bacterium]
MFRISKVDRALSPTVNMRRPLNRQPNSRKRRVRYVWLHVLPDDQWFRVPRGQTIWDALQPTDMELAGECGGLGHCGKCKVKVLSEPQEPTDEERALLGEDELEQGVRLACRTRANQDLTISTGEGEAAAEYVNILTTSHISADRYTPISQLEPLVEKRLVSVPFSLENERLSNLDLIRMGLGSEYEDLQASLHCLRTLSESLGETRFRGIAALHEHCLMDWQHDGAVNHTYGVVFDLGTSTLVSKLLSLVDGSEVGVGSCLNSQKRYGADLISRLQYCQEEPKGAKRLQSLLVKDLNQITANLLTTAGIEPEDILVAVAAGNTTMQHLLLGLSPVGIAQAPFSPVLTSGLVVSAADVGLHLHPAAPLYALPMKSGYIGGDLLAFIMASGVAEQQDEIILGLDLGTNGEVFLGNSRRLLTCSAAAGPALEGTRISRGMIARTGAIDGVSCEDGRLSHRVIGNVKPEGICGSGLVDLVAVLLHCGIIDGDGLIHRSRQRVARDLNSRIVTRSKVSSFLVSYAEDSSDQKPIYLTQKDVREFQLAKGAIAAGIRTLMDDLGVQVSDIGHVYLAGALGNYIDRLSALRTGLIPAVNPEIVVSLGNAASTGAAMVLLMKRYWQTAAELSQFIEHIELSCRSDFNQYFVEHMSFPEHNLW